MTNHPQTHSTLPTPEWPNEPEDLLKFIPDDLAGSPFEMLMCLLIRARGVIALLCSEFMGDGDFRPDDQEIVGALWTAQNQLQLARELPERLEAGG
jgi:hypothetical protein